MVQDVNSYFWDNFASFVYSGRKWRQVIHLFFSFFSVYVQVSKKWLCYTINKSLLHFKEPMCMIKFACKVPFVDAHYSNGHTVDNLTANTHGLKAPKHKCFSYLKLNKYVL